MEIDTSESQLYAAFKRVRNRIQKYYPDEIIMLCIRMLNRKDAASVERMVHWRPWELLLIIKWTYIYGDYLSPGRKHFSEIDLGHLTNLMWDMSECVRKPSKYEDLILFLRNLAFQQFWLQEPMVPARFSRQRYIFNRLSDDHYLKKQFLDRAGIKINEFILLSSVVLTAFLHDTRVIDKNWFGALKAYYGDLTIEKFLNILSYDLKSAREWLIEIKAGDSSINYQYYEQSPLKRYPLVNIGDKYYCYFPNLLAHSLNTFLYDFLKNTDPEGFMVKFGMIFEQYVHQCLSYAQLRLYQEKDLQRGFGTNNKLVDFIIHEFGSVILIDAKGVDLPYLGMVSHLPHVIKDKTKSSVLKGIDQAFGTINAIQGRKDFLGFEVLLEKTYLLIVTYKDLYIGSGVDFIRAVASDQFESIVENHGGKVLIPPENMYFISIDDLELMSECIHDHAFSLSELLGKAILDDKKPETKKFVFRQHVSNACPSINLVGFLEDEFNIIQDELKSILNPG